MALPGPGGRHVTAAAATSVDRAGSTAVITSTASSSGSPSSSGGHATQRGRPSRSRDVIGRIRPHSPHGSRTGTADSAVPVLTAALQRAQRVCRSRRRRVPKSSPRQPGAARSAGPRPRGAGRTAVDRAPPAGPTRAWARRRRLARPPATPATTPVIVDRSRPGSRRAIRSTMTPIGSASTSGANTADNGQPSTPVMRARLGRRRADTGVGAAGGAFLAGRCPPAATRFDQLVHRSSPGCPAAPSGSSGSAARGVRRPAGRPGWRTAGSRAAPTARSGRWWRTCRAGHHLPQVPAVVEFARHSASPSGAQTAWSSNAGPSALRSAVFMKSPDTWV